MPSLPRKRKPNSNTPKRVLTKMKKEGLTMLNQVKRNRDSTDKAFSGIYIIKNIINGKYYLGSSNNLENRFKQHLNHLLKGTHHSVILQRAFDKYGSDNFQFEIIKYVSVDNLLIVEQRYLNINSCDYNISSNAISYSGNLSKSQCIKIINKYKKGFTIRQLANEFNKSTGSISLLLNGKTYSHFELPLNDISKIAKNNLSNHGVKKRKLTNENVKFIRNSKINKTQLSKLFNVDFNVINNIINFKTYKDV